MTVVLLALASAALFGVMTVALRAGLRGAEARSATLATLLAALAVSVVAFAVAGANAHGAWPFLLAGLLAPGGSQILFTLSIREAGASRTSVVVGTAPLVAVALALVALDEPVRVPLVTGAFLIVGGGVVLASERDRPDHLRALGLLYALGATVLFAVRDNVVRALHGEAYARGRVSVVSPLVATESLWGVALAALVFRHTEGVGRKLAAGALLVVAGGVLIGVSR